MLGYPSKAPESQGSAWAISCVTVQQGSWMEKKIKMNINFGPCSALAAKARRKNGENWLCRLEMAAKAVLGRRIGSRSVRTFTNQPRERTYFASTLGNECEVVFVAKVVPKLNDFGHWRFIGRAAPYWSSMPSLVWSCLLKAFPSDLLMRKKTWWWAIVLFLPCCER